MRTFLVVEKLLNPGVYSVELSNMAKEFIKENVNLKFPFFQINKLYNLIYARTLKYKQESYDLLNINSRSEILKDKSVLPFGIDEMMYFTNSPIFKTENNNLNESLYLFYNEQFFQGCFNSEEHFKLVFPSNTYAELIIVDRKFVNKYFKNTKDIKYGLNVELEGFEELIPLSHLIEKSWQKLTVLIREVFFNLGAIEIHIKEKKDNTGNIEFDYKKIESMVKCKINTDFKYDFVFDQTRSNGFYKPENIKHLLPTLEKYAPQFAQSAKEQITMRDKGEIHYSETIDMTFGISLNIVAVFQGGFKYGYKKNISLDVVYE